MNFVQLLLDDQRRRHLKLVLLGGVSYFFLGISEGAFFTFQGSDTLINFVFTVFCVGSSWVFFKALYPLLVRWVGEGVKARLFITFTLVLFLSSYITALNWVYIELFWREELGSTLFFSIVLPLAIILFLTWALFYPKFRQFLTRPTKEIPILVEVHRGKQKMLIPLAEILGFVVENKLVFFR